MLNKKLGIILSIVFSVCILGGGITGIVSGVNQNKVNDRVEEQVTLINTTLDDMKSTDTTLHSNINSLNTRVTTLESTLTIVQTTIKGLSDDLADTKKELTTVQITLINEINSIKEDIDELKEKDTDLQNQINTLTTALENEINGVKEWTSETYLTIANWDTFKNEINGKINNLFSRVTSIESSINVINTTLAALQKQVDKNTQDIEDLIHRVDCLEGIHEAEAYTWADDFSSCTASGNCKHCGTELVTETTTNINVDGFKYTAVFASPLLKDQTIDLTDLTTVPSKNHESALNIIFSKKNENVTLNLPENFGTDELSRDFTGLNLISNAIKSNATNVNLTLKGVKKISFYSFKDNKYLTSINSPDTTLISNDAFYNCTNLKSVNFPKVTKIYAGVFRNCTSLDEIVLPSVTDLGDMFNYASFQKIKLGSVVTNVFDSNIFENFDTTNCILVLAKGQKDFDEMTMIEKEMSSGDTTFCGCDFKKIIVGEVFYCDHENTFISYFWSNDFSSCTAKLICENCVETIKTKTVNTTFNNFIYSADFNDTVMPSITIDLTDLTLMSSALYENAINIVFSKGITNITLNLPNDFDANIIKNAISKSSVNVNLTLKGIEKISRIAFKNCEKLQSINLPDVIEIGEYAFEYCSNLVSVSAEKVQKLEKWAFSYCKNVTELSFPEATEIGEDAFHKCTKLSKISLPKLTKVSSNLFDSCENLKQINLPSVTELGSYAFYRSSLESITFGSQITKIGQVAFNYLDEDCIITLAKGQKNFNIDDEGNFIISENEVEAGENKTFCGKTFKEIIIAE